MSPLLRATAASPMPLSLHVLVLALMHPLWSRPLYQIPGTIFSLHLSTIVLLLGVSNIPITSHDRLGTDPLLLTIGLRLVISPILCKRTGRGCPLDLSYKYGLVVQAHRK